MRLATLALLALTTPALADTVPLGPNPVLGGGEFSTGGGITVAIEPRRAQDGQLALCGVWAESERLTAILRPEVRDILAPATLAVNGRVVRHDLRIFPQVAAAETYAGAPSDCVGTGLPYSAAPDIEIRIPRKTVVRERSSRGPSFDITFMPRSGENPALGAGSILPAHWTRAKSTGDTYPTQPRAD